MRLIVIASGLLLALIPRESQAQSYDWFLGDQHNGTGKFSFGTFTRSRNGSIIGSGTVYRHDGRALILRGNEKNKIFSVTYMEDGIQKTEAVAIGNLRKRTTSIYRGSFTSDGKTYQFGAIQK